jgi:hypothetical protein
MQSAAKPPKTCHAERSEASFPHWSQEAKIPRFARDDNEEKPKLTMKEVGMTAPFCCHAERSEASFQLYYTKKLFSYSNYPSTSPST